MVLWIVSWSLEYVMAVHWGNIESISTVAPATIIPCASEVYSKWRYINSIIIIIIIIMQVLMNRYASYCSRISHKLKIKITKSEYFTTEVNNEVIKQVIV